MEFGADLEHELAKRYWNLTDSEWARLSRKQRAVKAAVFRIVCQYPELR